MRYVALNEHTRKSIILLYISGIMVSRLKSPTGQKEPGQKVKTSTVG